MHVVKLSDSEIQAHLTDLPGWAVENDALVRTYRFPGFPEAIRFVNALAEHAERLQHHPDIDIRYSRVTLRLTTHDVGGISMKDFGLAQEAESDAPLGHADDSDTHAA
ncbi:MAG: 4a-hydroxytetrahydrobiopterin dehydratase [Capsulimonadales bacterium]|nr:4a-hydroxytetrahydrobiopterin dehydratase [Capsulimonadales bacterium]